MYDYLALQIGIAFILDIVIGDPRWLPHPVRIIGKCVEFLERLLKKVFISERPAFTVHVDRLAGVFLAGVIVSGTYLITYEIINIFSHTGRIVEIAISTIIVFFSLSTRDLLKEAKGILEALKSGNIIKARENLSRVVGRDTHNLNEHQITRGCIETTAENSVDGIIAPLFYAFIGGPALAMAYKAVNTLDSMIGYKNTEYINLGWASAKLDDIVNYVPARIAAIMLPISSYICAADYLNSTKIVKRDGRKHPSPNSGIPEAAIAGALGIRLGGSSTYKGITADKPSIGDPVNDIVLGNINQTIRIVFVAAVLSVVSGIIIILIVNKFALLIG
ncbi:MAG: adenosylcobinamide-phosphate synthase CbiB [Candidatus Scalinduaceae bacterium]